MKCLAMQMLEGLNYLHQHDIIHRYVLTNKSFLVFIRSDMELGMSRWTIS